MRFFNESCEYLKEMWLCWWSDCICLSLNMSEWLKESSRCFNIMYIFSVEQDCVSFGFFSSLKIESKDVQSNKVICFYCSPCLLTTLVRSKEYISGQILVVSASCITKTYQIQHSKIQRALHWPVTYKVLEYIYLHDNWVLMLCPYHLKILLKIYLISIIYKMTSDRFIGHNLALLGRRWQCWGPVSQCLNVSDSFYSNWSTDFWYL